MADRLQEVLARYRGLKEKRSLWMQHWEDLARVQLPRRLGFVTSVIEGDRRTEDVYDGTSIQSARSLANQFGGRLRPEGEPWFFLRAVEDADMQTDEAKEWLADTEQRLRDVFDDPRARFRQASGEADLDLVVFGTAIMGIFEQVGKKALLFQSCHLKDAIPVFDHSGNLEGMFKTRKLTLAQAEKMFGREKLSEATRRKFEGGEKELDDKLEFLFAVLPRKDGRPDAKLARNLPFASTVIEMEAQHEVESSGYHEMPYIAPRWDTSSGEDYGRSPGMVALPDSNTAQAIGETMLVAGQRAADPPILVPSDAFIDAPNTFPGGLGHYEADAIRDLGFDPFKILDVGRNFPLSREMMLDTREMIRSAFLRDRFNLPLPGEANMTATEVNARLKEFISEMGPVFGRLEADYTAPMVERAFKLVMRAGGFKPVPPALQGRSVTFEYESPVKRIREQAAASVTEQWVMAHIEVALKTQKPEILDTINFDEYSRFSARALGVPHGVINGQDRVEQMRQARNQALQEAQAEAKISSTVDTLDVAASAAQKAGLTGKPQSPGSAQ